MSKYVKAEELTEHKFPNVTFERYVSDGRTKSEEEIYAYKVGYNDAIDRIVEFAPPADVVSRDMYDRLFEKYEEVIDKLYILHDQFEVQNMLIKHFFIERRDDDTN